MTWNTDSVTAGLHDGGVSISAVALRDALLMVNSITAAAAAH